MGFHKKFAVGLVALVVGAGVVALPGGAKAVTYEPKVRSFTYNAETNALVAGSSFTPAMNAGALNAAANGTEVIYGTDLESSNFTAYPNFIGRGDGSATPIFDAPFDGGLTLAVGDVASAPGNELIAGQATGGSMVRVRTIPIGTGTANPVSEFRAYEEGFTGGVRVAVGDVDGDGTSEIITAPGPGRAPTVKAFRADGTLVASRDVYASDYTGGVYVAAANVDNDAVSEVAVSAGSSPHVRLLDGLSGQPLFEVFAFAATETAPVRVALGTVSGTPLLIATSHTSQGAMVRAFKADGQAGSAVAVSDADGDLHPFIGDGKLNVVDAAPRLSLSTVTQLKDHSRGVLVLHGAGLVATLQDVTIGTEEQGAYVTYLAASPDNGVEVGYAIPAGATGAFPITATVSTPGSTATHELTLDNVSIAARANELREFVTTSPFSAGAPHVRTFTDQGPVGNGFYANADFEGAGARVSRGDIDGDGVDEVITATPAGPIGQVAVDNADGSHRFTLVPYGNAYRSGIFVAVGDVLPDLPGNEIVTGADAGGGPHVRIYNKDGGVEAEFFAYGENFRGGVRVAVGDVDGDGAGDIITSVGPGGAPHVQAISATEGQIRSFYAYDQGFSGGVYVAAADIDGDGVDEIITAPGAGGGPHVREWGPNGAIGGFMAYAENFRGGVTVARVGDDIVGPNLIAVGAGPGGGPHVQVFDPDGTSLDSFYAYAPNFAGGVWVAGGIA